MIKNLILFASLFILTACNNDDLENEINRLKNLLGADEPLVVEFYTKDDQDRDISLKTEYNFKSGGADIEGIYLLGNGKIEVYIERFGAVERRDGGFIAFEYDLTTKQVGDRRCDFYFQNRFAEFIEPTFQSVLNGHTVDISIKYLNIETGIIEVVVTANTTSDADENLYIGKAMSANLRFKGKLRVFETNSAS